MKRALVISLILAILSFAHVRILDRTAASWKSLPTGEGTVAVISPELLKITSLEYDGIVSDFLFLKALVFLGSTAERKLLPGNQRVKGWEWKWLDNLLEASVGLDPYFRDPYYFGNAQLTWAAGMVHEANALLEKGIRYRSWDALLPFFCGFNHFYFLGENQRASELLMEASRRPNGLPAYASLASKLAFKEMQAEVAVAFLTEIIKRTDEPTLREDFVKRRQALSEIIVLQRGVDYYTRRHGRAPASLETLKSAGIIHELTPDPFGGRYYVDGKGIVKTTNEERLMPRLRR